MADEPRPVLVLGAGINGAAIARELLLNGVPVVVVDQADVASGATAFSSRLIHGGLRYLEYGDFDLVRESLAERTRLLRLAPQFVRPLELFIPVRSRMGGLVASARRFLGHESGEGESGGTPPRGLWLARAGLWFYDRWARDPTLPRHRVYRATDNRAVPVDPRLYRWEMSYHDAQIVYPERFVLALLEDARRLAIGQGLTFRVWTYCRALLDGVTAEIRPAAGGDAVATFRPAAIVNATGAWVDRTLARMSLASRRLIGGTKGSHLVTSSSRLRSLLGDRGIYVEAADGRPVFILPWAGNVLIGTTDVPFERGPEQAVAGDDEIDYLLDAVNQVLPQAALGQHDIDSHYSGVRPLPYADAATPAAITRRHALHWHTDAPLPLCSVIGGKLTTCRSLAEEAAGELLTRLGLRRSADSRERTIPGGHEYPSDAAALEAAWRRLSQRSGWTIEQVRAVWPLIGTRTEEVVDACAGQSATSLPGTDLPAAFARWIIEHEWVTTLDDLVERRLMLIFDPRLSVGCLVELAGLLAAAGRLAPSDLDAHVKATIRRLGERYGKKVQGG
jgi:glycerol-3-phosphate dehydrogenase